MPQGDPPSAAALARADRLFAALIARSTLSPMEDAEAAFNAYRQAAKKGADTERAQRGIARALFRLGRYQASAAVYGGLRRPGVEGETARRYAAFAGRLANRLPEGRFVMHLFPLSSDRWAAITTRRKLANNRWIQELKVDLRVVRDRPTGPKLESGPWELSMGDDPLLEATFFRGETPGWVTVQTRRIGGDWAPNEVWLYRIHPKGLKPVKEFYSSGPTLVQARQGAPLVAVTPTWKVWWTDVYEWSGREFRLANGQHPEIYRSQALMVPAANAVGHWLTRAAKITTERDRQTSLRAWQDAAKYVRLAAEGKYDGEEERFGKLSEVRRQVASRIEWLRRDEWNHALLYRPYDWDLQVPPYRLGKAKR